MLPRHAAKFLSGLENLLFNFSKDDTKFATLLNLYLNRVIKFKIRKISRGRQYFKIKNRALKDFLLTTTYLCFLEFNRFI